MTQSALIEYVVKIIFFACLSYFLCSMFMFFIHNSGNRAAYLFRKKIISSILKKTPPFFKKYTSGDILARTSNDVAAVENYFASGFVMLMDSFAYPGVTIFMMSVLISWKLTLAKASCYRHFGREDAEFTWERTDKIQDLLTATKA